MTIQPSTLMRGTLRRAGPVRNDWVVTGPPPVARRGRDVRSSTAADGEQRNLVMRVGVVRAGACSRHTGGQRRGIALRGG
jgi:hypothetical protein